MVLEVPMRVFVDVRAVEPDLVVFHAGKGVADLSLAGAERLDLRAVQGDASLERFENVIIPARFWIAQYVSHPARKAKKGRRLADAQTRDKRELRQLANSSCAFSVRSTPRGAPRSVPNPFSDPPVR